jgi:hypothetical protein
MLVLAEGLFRLDITVTGDTLRSIVRNFTEDELRMNGGPYGPDGANVVLGQASAYAPARTALEFSIGSVDVSVTIGTLRFADRGTVRVSAQAIVRQA